jgi:AraC-like DNA-binding protein
MSDSHLSHIKSYAEHNAALPITAFSLVQLERGPLDVQSLKFTGRDLVAVRPQMTPLSVGSIAIRSDWCSFGYPLRWDGDFRFNGVLASPGDIFLVSSAEGYASVARKRSTLAIGIRKERLCSLISARTGIDGETLDLSDKILSAVPGANAFCADFVERAYFLSDELKGISHHRLIGERAEAVLLDRFLDFHEKILTTNASRREVATDSRICVRRVEAALETIERVPRTLGELCALSGAGKTRLSSAFNDIFGLSPVRFLRLRALTIVHERLQDTDNPAPSVKSVALEQGFLNKGRFSAEYQQVFGEHPSTTLARARAGLRSLSRLDLSAKLR